MFCLSRPLSFYFCMESRLMSKEPNTAELASSNLDSSIFRQTHNEACMLGTGINEQLTLMSRHYFAGDAEP